MFEWTKSNDEISFRQCLSSNPFLKKFLIKYFFEEGFIFFNKRKVTSQIKLKEGEVFRTVFIKHILQKKKEIVKEEMGLQSFQHLIYVLSRLRSDTTRHYEILLPYLVQLKKEDLPYVVDVLLEKFKLKDWQMAILKGGI